jgi:hypothetical protein
LYGPPPQVPPGFGPPPSQPAQKTKRRLLLRIGAAVVGVLAFVIAKAVIGGLFAYSPTALGGNAGDCLKVTSFSQRFTADNFPTKIDCGDLSANVKIALRFDDLNATCPGKQLYDELTLDRPATKFCLMVNAKEQDCLANDASGTGYLKLLCSDPSAKAKVTKVVAGTADDKLCGDTGGALSYPEPPTTYCFGPPNG